jgi:RNA polymerase sigma-70 factor (ECF subfamily)
MCPILSCKGKEQNLREPETDTDWFALFVAGNETAFNRIYREFKAAIYCFSRKKLNNHTDAQDVTSSTFSSLWDARRSMQSKPHIKHFLFLVARNAAIDLLRTRQVSTSFKLVNSGESEIKAENKLERIIVAEMIEEIFAEVRTLTERRREIFLLIYRHQRTPTEVAAMTGLLLPTVYSHLRNACHSLRTRLLEKGFERSLCP